MGVSRLDTVTLLSGAVAGGTTGTNFAIPVNGLVSFHLGFTALGGGTLSIEAYDGVNWNAVPCLTLTAATIQTLQGVALGLRAKLTGGTGATGLSLIAVLVDFGG